MRLPERWATEFLEQGLAKNFLSEAAALLYQKGLSCSTPLTNGAKRLTPLYLKENCFSLS
jgi:hypothetical protein